MSGLGYPKVSVTQSATNLLKRPGVHLQMLLDASITFKKIVHAITDNSLIFEQVEINLKYQGYLKRDLLMADKILRLDLHKIPASFKYDTLSGLSNEGREKLIKFQPDTIGQASRILGVSPSDISVLMVRIGR
jgi:tRNA uridine 5-carboxymethylaminomethyl modification enzyme